MYLVVGGRWKPVEIRAGKLRRLRWWERAVEALAPPLRLAREERLRAAMRWLVDHPEVRVRFE
jgi:hypothetical protein